MNSSDSKASALNEMLSLTFSASCAADAQFNGKVIIIGAGAAGLAAAYFLNQKGVKCVVLEASARYGGRLKKLEDFTDFSLDTGAEWLHDRTSVVGDLVTRTRTKVYEEHSPVFYWFDNQLRTDLPNPDVQLLSKTKDVPDITIKDYAQQQQWGSEYDAVLECLAGDIGGSAENVSAYWALQQYADPDNVHVNYRFAETYFDLIEKTFAFSIAHLIQLNTEIIQIDYSGNEIILRDRNDTFQADKVIITVPITILKSNAIQFMPSLSAEKLNAFDKIGMEAGMKVYMKFRSKFYRSGCVIGCPIGCTYYDETYGKQTNDHILQAFIVGKSAANLSNLSNKQIVDALLEELDAMYDKQATPAFLDEHIENWTVEPFIKGAYSYPKVGINDTRKIAAQNVDSKLFFAGEAMNTNLRTHTVHGAIETGILAVIDIFNASK